MTLTQTKAIINVLNAGFVCTDRVDGDDDYIVKIARKSYNAPSDEDREGTVERRLLYLVKHKHHVPLEFGVMVFEIKAPIFVAEQIYTYRMASRSRRSLRYTEADPEFYIPDYLDSSITSLMRESYTLAYKLYIRLRKLHVKRQVARVVLPTALYTSWYFKIDLNNLGNLLRHRLDSHAQEETRRYAQAMFALTEQAFPLWGKAFKEVYPDLKYGQ